MSLRKEMESDLSKFYPGLPTTIDWPMLLAMVRQNLAESLNAEPLVPELQKLPSSLDTSNAVKFMDSLRDNKDVRKHFPHPRIPRPPNRGDAISSDKMAYHISRIQTYFLKLGYNHLGYVFHEFSKKKSLRFLMLVAKDMIYHALPIKCLEACVLGVHMTMDMEVDRIPMSFKSEASGDTYKHIVLIIRHRDKWGALGLSRRADLMYKPLTYPSLDALVQDFIQSYKTNYHLLLKVKIGLPVIHDGGRNEPIVWKFLILNIQRLCTAEIKTALETHAKLIQKHSPFK